jgi:FtsZ-binding cell division protein ZapB
MEGERLKMDEKPSLDERLKAAIQSLELLSHEMEEMKVKTARLDAAERHHRAAILTGVAAYLRALNENGDVPPEPR